MLYDTVLLRTFVRVCDSGSFTKAAREVNLTQSAVSLHVKRLEEQVGARLILRNARGITLTATALHINRFISVITVSSNKLSWQASTEL